ncbi:hypothetical protein ACE02U_15070 [Shewanella xiamenensis]|uniref:hypothetical protein n=1 Tax=Shewanella xiamenensis TaxID=332186 RepID=UPI0035BB3CA4
MNKLTTTLIGGVVLSLLAPSVTLAKPEHDKRDTGLPPGLQKKVDKGQPLPPGWQKKLHRGDILDYDIYDRGRIVVPLDREGRISIQVEGAIIKLDEKSRKILDIVNIITD